jgi:hypothetical protein
MNTLFSNLERIEALSEEISNLYTSSFELIPSVSIKDGTEFYGDLDWKFEKLVEQVKAQEKLRLRLHTGLYKKFGNGGFMSEIKIGGCIINFYGVNEEKEFQLEMIHGSEDKIKIIYISPGMEHFRCFPFNSERFYSYFFLIDAKVEEKVAEYLTELNNALNKEEIYLCEKTNTLIFWMKENLSKDEWFYYK